ncbi:MAG: 4'-phosphopantetheinyl transferase superfamily protein [Gammaproteobacteria bacterium]|nr:4'-phosphopantetheinyl transferase superfamily protein [Gammaproteobacteria bacterium]
MVAHTPVRELSPAELKLIPGYERDREFGSRKRQQQFLCGRALLRLMLQRWSGESADSHKLVSGQDGKPSCVGGPAVSITHSGDLVACGLAEAGELGIDLEDVDPHRDTLKIAHKFFSDEEAGWLDAQPRDRFFMLWVLKEAYVKALGQSIFGGINRLRCIVEPPNIEIRSTGERIHALCLYTMGGRYLALAATQAPLAAISFVRWEAGSEQLVSDEGFGFMARTNDRAK